MDNLAQRSDHDQAIQDILNRDSVMFPSAPPKYEDEQKEFKAMLRKDCKAWFMEIRRAKGDTGLALKILNFLVFGTAAALACIKELPMAPGHNFNKKYKVRLGGYVPLSSTTRIVVSLRDGKPSQSEAFFLTTSKINHSGN